MAISTSKTLLACVIGVFLAWLVARTDVPFRGLIEIAAPLPFFVPGLLATMGWAILANPTNGVYHLTLTDSVLSNANPAGNLDGQIRLSGASNRRVATSS